MSGAFEIVMGERKALVDKIIGMMKQGYFFNKEEWDRASLRPQNPLSKVQYKGGNRLRLMAMVVEHGYGRPYHQAPINKAIHRIVRDYNLEEETNAAKEKREPFLLPHFSCHHIRHTFATRLCENESNVKAIQEIMGHADIQTTLNVYAEATKEVKHKAMDNLQEGWKIF